MYPRFLQFGSLVLSTYGVLAVVAALCGVTLWSSIGRRCGLDAAKLWNAGLLAVLCVIAGARLAVVVANWRGFLVAPLLILRAGTWGSGSTALFGLLLAIVACGIYLRRASLPFLRSLDAAAPALAVVAAVLDVGDFAAGAHYGAPTTLPWGATFTSRFAARTTGVPLGIPLHPVEIYASIAHFTLAAVLLALLRQGGRAGEVLGAGLFAEGVLRFLLAPLSGDYSSASVLLHMATPTQALGMLLVVLGGACWLSRGQQKVTADVR